MTPEQAERFVLAAERIAAARTAQAAPAADLPAFPEPGERPVVVEIPEAIWDELTPEQLAEVRALVVEHQAAEAERDAVSDAAGDDPSDWTAADTDALLASARRVVRARLALLELVPGARVARCGRA